MTVSSDMHEKTGTMDLKHIKQVFFQHFYVADSIYSYILWQETKNVTVNAKRQAKAKSILGITANNTNINSLL